jgi:hypothetical protein
VQALLGCDFCHESRSIEVDDHDLGGVSGTADEKVLDVKIGMATSEVVESAHRRSRSTRRSL